LPLPLAVFTYLAELHDRKLNSGHLQQGAAMPVLEAGVAAADSSEAATCGSYHTPSVTAAITLADATDEQQHKQQQQKAYSSKPLPASVELHPSVQRGKKSMATKLKKKLTKAKFTECSIQ
jgi:hypothetical protein